MEKNPELIRIVEFGQAWYPNCLWCGEPLMRPDHRESGFCCLWCEDKHAVAIAEEKLVDVTVVT